jgi:hypothetical protein
LDVLVTAAYRAIRRTNALFTLEYRVAGELTPALQPCHIIPKGEHPHAKTKLAEPGAEDFNLRAFARAVDTGEAQNYRPDPFSAIAAHERKLVIRTDC